MITLMTLLIITCFIVAIALALLSVGGTIFTVLASDIIVALFVIWLIFKACSKKKKK